MNTKNTDRIKPFSKKNRFYNHCDDKPESFLFQTVPSFISSLYGRKKRQPENKNEWFVEQDPLKSSNPPVITWIGHATFLIQIGGLNILTDPIFGDASLFFPRIFAPGIALNRLPTIDCVILSHNHRDHCDLYSLDALKKRNPSMTILAPQGDKAWLEKKGLSVVVEHEWWNTYERSGPDGACIFTFLPAHHWSAKGIFDRNKSLWGSWMISYKDHHIYFAGDSAYAGHYHQIAHHFPQIHTALMPIAPEQPHPWMRKSHLDAAQAVQAFIDLKAQQFIPMHWGTFPFGLDTFNGPLERLKLAWATHQLSSPQKLIIPKIGERLAI